MGDAYCSDCKKIAVVVFDNSSGDTVCSECGLVLESHSIDETSEWRTFANESADYDPVRVGAPTNPLLADAALSTVISKPNGVTSDFRTTSRGYYPDRSLILAFKTIADMSDRLGLVATIKPVGFKLEICSVAIGVSKKKIGLAMKDIVKQLELEKGQSVEMGTIHAGDFMRRFCSNLGMTKLTVKAAQEAVQKSEEFDISKPFPDNQATSDPRCLSDHFRKLRADLLEYSWVWASNEYIFCRRCPTSIAAAVIYIVTQLSDKKKTLKDVSLATGDIAEGTIRNSYKDLYPHLAKIIPTWYAQEKDLKNLHSP
ncbi:hypothetical protein AgCh_001752 [Apium graveolens]